MLSYISVNNLHVYILITRVERGYNVIGLCNTPPIPSDFCGANYFLSVNSNFITLG
jgi:hypothetical protein